MFYIQVENMIEKSLNEDLNLYHATGNVDRITDLHLADYGMERGSARIVFDTVDESTMCRIRNSDIWQINEINAEKDTVVMHLLETPR